jgi:hypothetical protein
MEKITLFHGTSEKNAKQIKKEGFISGKNSNWEIKSKKYFVHLSTAYAPFFAMQHNTKKLALIKVEVDISCLYPDDDFIMRALGKTIYTQEDIDSVDMEQYKKYWEKSLQYMGSVSCFSNNCKIIGITYFSGKDLISKCDPMITPKNYYFLGDYYKKLSNYIFETGSIVNFNFKD